MDNIQADTLPPIPGSARYLTFDLASTDNIDNTLIELARFTAKHSMVTAFGEPHVKAILPTCKTI